MQPAKVQWIVRTYTSREGFEEPRHKNRAEINWRIGMSKALAKEVEAFNIRVLTVLLGTFNTGMGEATILGENPLPEDYKGSFSEKLMEMMSTGKFAPNGDKDKAMNAVYQVVAGEGVGKGHESEKILPLGRDLAARIQIVQDSLSRSLEIFGSVCKNVHLGEE